MLQCFYTDQVNDAIAIHLVAEQSFAAWLETQSDKDKAWLSANGFKPKSGSFCLLPATSGQIEKVVLVMHSLEEFLIVGQLALSLPEGNYYFADAAQENSQNYVLAWALGSYQFTKYKKAERVAARLFVSAQQCSEAEKTAAAIYSVRDLINTPAEDMGPSELAGYVQVLAKLYGAQYKEIVGEALLAENFPCIHTVGRASDDAPRLLDLTWGDAQHPKLTLVGKGVCFDTGGLDLKLSPYMDLMKKDMGGAANVLGLAHMIMSAELPVRLRVLIPAVENAVSGSAYRPGDVITTRSGLTVEVGNTDAEGRLVLADALVEASSESPDLLIDMATLTGAARVAVGPDLPAMFTNKETLAQQVLEAGKRVSDPVWHMPLFAGYRGYIDSSIADLANQASEPYGGAITAALFLQSFVPENVAWMHFDIMAWNIRAKPSKPKGGEAMGIRALFAYLQERYSS